MLPCAGVIRTLLWDCPETPMHKVHGLKCQHKMNGPSLRASRKHPHLCMGEGGLERQLWPMCTHTAYPVLEEDL